MAKFYGKIGYVDMVETSPGIWEEKIVEHNHFGEQTRHSSKFVTSQNLNDNIDITAEVSIIADLYSINNFQKIRYIEFMGSKWKVTSVEIKNPRLILTIGGLYNGE